MNKKQHFVTTWPRKTTCPKCGRTILDGLDEGIPYRADPIPLTIPGEIEAILQRRTTYRLLAGHLVHRTTENISAETPDTRSPIYATHQCQPPDLAHISIRHITQTQQLITNKYFEKTTQEQDNDHEVLLTIADALNGKVIKYPHDQDPPF